MKVFNRKYKYRFKLMGINQTFSRQNVFFAYRKSYQINKQEDEKQGV